VISPTLLNTARVSFSRTFPHLESPSGLIGPNYSFVTGKEMAALPSAVSLDSDQPQLLPASRSRISSRIATISFIHEANSR